MYCSNCGAEISPDDRNCPYCGMLNAYGAEKDYMRKLEGIKQQTKDLEDVAEREMTGQVKKQGRKVALVVGILAAIVLIFVVAGIFVRIIAGHKNAADNKDKLDFQRKYFDELTDVYDSGDDEAVYQFLMDHMEEKGSDAFYSWPHSTYYFSIYPVNLYIEEYREDVLNKNADSEDLGYVIYWILDALYDPFYEDEMTDPRDAARMEETRARGRAFLSDDLGISQEEQDDLYERVKMKELDIPDLKKCLKEAETIWQDNNK